jgi:hypothetical protein
MTDKEKPLNINEDGFLERIDSEADQWAYEIIESKADILERIVTIFELQKKHNVGDPKVLQSLYKTEKQLKKKIKKFRLKKPFDHKQLETFLSNQLEDLLIELQRIINEFKLFEEYPDIEDWYPDLDQNKPETRKERVQRVEEIYREVEHYPTAIKQFNDEMGEEIYQDYDSFKTARWKVRNKE